MMDLRGLRVACLPVVLLALGLAACSQGSDIRLEGPAKPTAPPARETTPSDTTSSNTSSDTPAVPGTPTAPKDPTAPPNVGDTPANEPPKPAAVRYRMFCDDRYPPYMTAISSMASPSGFGAGIENTELVGGKIRKLEYLEHPQVIALPKFGSARVLFSAKRVPLSTANMAQARRLFVTDIDITIRSGEAKELGLEFGISAALATQAAREKLSVRTFGVSDQGRYLLIGQADGYKVLDATSLREIGVLKIGSASSNVNPHLRESDMIFSVGALGAGGFESKLFAVGFGADGRVKSLKTVSVTSGLRRPLASIGPEPGESYAALDLKNRVAVVSPLKSAATFVKVSSLPSKGGLASSSAFWRDGASGELHGAIAFERIVDAERSSVLNDRYKIEQVFGRVVNVDENSLTANAIVPDFDYPSDARQTIESGIGAYGGVPGLTELKTSPDGKAIFALFPGSLAKQVYRLTENGFDRVSQESCTNLSIGVEK